MAAPPSLGAARGHRRPLEAEEEGVARWAAACVRRETLMMRSLAAGRYLARALRWPPDSSAHGSSMRREHLRLRVGHSHSQGIRFGSSSPAPVDLSRKRVARGR